MSAKASLASLALVVLATALLLSGCGSGSNSPNGSTEQKEGSRSNSSPEFPHGAGQGAPISKIIVARRTGRRRGVVPGLQSNGASGCPDLEGRPEIGLYTDVPVPD